MMNKKHVLVEMSSDNGRQEYSHRAPASPRWAWEETGQEPSARESPVPPCLWEWE